MKKVLYFILGLTLLASCKETEYEIHQDEFFDMIISNHVDSVEIINIQFCEVYLKPQFIVNYTSEFENIRVTGPQFYFYFGSADYIENQISVLQSDTNSEELIKVKYSDRKTLTDKLLILLLDLHGLIAIIFFFIILMKQFDRKTDKVVWIVMVVCLPFIGVILYGLIGRKQVKKRNSV